MKQKLFLLAFAIFCTVAAFAQQSFYGRVSVGSTPLQGVVVTDGQNTVKTGKDGRFQLPGYERTHFITVTTPSGYRAEQYYLPVDPARKSYDFVLVPNKASSQDNHSFIQITDTEIHNRGVATNWVDFLKQYIANEDCAFMVHTGDICYESGLKMHKQVVNAETMNVPVYYCIGNHDLVKGETGEQVFESVYGPGWYSFDAGNVHYVVSPMAGGDHKPGYTREEVLRWLKNDLAMMTPGRQLVAFNHDILSVNKDFFFGTKDNYIDLRKYNLKAWIYGHWHVNYVRNQEGVYTVCTSTLDKGGIDHSASAFRIVRMTKDSIADMNLHYCFVDHHTVIACPANGQTAPTLSGNRIPLSVNAYHSGCEVKRVSYAIRREDGRYGTPQALKQLTDWNWYAEITNIAPPAKRMMEIEVTTEFSDGKTNQTYSRFTCSSPKHTQPQATEDWPNLLKDAAHTGNTTVNLQPPLRLAWINNAGSNIFMSSPLIAENKIFVASVDDSNIRQQAIVAMDVRTGQTIWKFRPRNSIKNSIAYNNHTVFAQDADGNLYALDAASGQLKWERRSEIKGFPYVEDGLIAENGIVYAGTGQELRAYKVEDGSVIWNNTAWNKGEGTTMTLGLGGKVLTSGAQWGSLYGHDAQTGALLWKQNKEGLSNRGASTVYKDGRFYLISKNSFFIIEPQTGEILAQKQLAEFSLDVTSSPLITDSEIIFGTAGNGLMALDKESLNIKWNTPTGQSLVYTAPYTTVPSATIESSPILSNGIVYFGASDGFLYGVKAGTGEIIWKYETGAPVFSSMALSGNMLVATDYSGNVYAFLNER